MIRLTDVGKRYGRGDVASVALSDVNFTIETGEFAMVIGPSGSGKSTLMHLIGGLDKPTHGAVEVDDMRLDAMSDQALARYRNRKIGFVFQSFHLVPHLTALENVMLPLMYTSRRIDRRRRATRLLAAVGLKTKLPSRPNQLSGGEQQRVAICRALANNPDIILADEPTGNLDTRTGGHVMEILSLFHRRWGKTIVLVTHDPRFSRFATRTIQVEDGRVFA